MKTKSVSESTCSNSRRVIGFVPRSILALAALLTLVALPSFSALATQCEPCEFSESGGYPATAYIYVTTATPGATMFATVGNHYIPVNPTHSGSIPTHPTFNCGGTFAVFVGDSKYVKCIVYKAGMTDSAMTSYALDNTGN